MDKKYLLLILGIVVIVLISFLYIINVPVNNVKYPYPNIESRPVGNIVNVSFPIDNDDEAISYALSLKDFTEIRENNTNHILRVNPDFKTEWTVRPIYRTVESEIQLINLGSEPDKKNIPDYRKNEYQNRIDEVKARGEYWDLTWSLGSTQCTVLFRADGTVLNYFYFMHHSTGEKYRCMYMMQ